ncbi:FlgD immunoglobulin-like domain containing protein [Pseudomonadota bacterium]
MMNQKRGEFPALQNSFDRLLSGIPEEARKEHLFMLQYLKERFRGDTEADIIEKLGTYTMGELVQRPSISKAIHFETMVASNVRVEILDSAGNVVRHLVDAELPVGQYWMYWDRKDNNGKNISSLSGGGPYSYRVLYDEKLEITGTLSWTLGAIITKEGADLLS